MINIEVQIDQETRETWYFHMFDLNAVFVYWKREIKPKGKRKWIIERSWDKYKERDLNSTPRPELPEIIRSQALSEVMKMIRVYTWDEWKKK